MIRFTGLVENTKESSEFINKHGLCIYIETSKHKILFDLGPDNTYIRNASKLGIKLDEVDTVVISHGHRDHGGALKSFLQLNTKAKIYIKESAFDGHYTKVLGIPFSVGLDGSLKDNRQIVFTDNYLVIDDELTLFSGVTDRELYSQANNKLFSNYDGKISLDKFEHEQYLVISDEDKNYLVSGCSHNGIVNILAKYKTISDKTNRELEMVMGGFHLFNPVTKKYESDSVIKGVAKCLNNYDCRFYTCHCTGTKAYDILKTHMGDKLNYLFTGSKIEIN